MISVFFYIPGKNNRECWNCCNKENGKKLTEKNADGGWQNIREDTAKDVERRNEDLAVRGSSKTSLSIRIE